MQLKALALALVLPLASALPAAENNPRAADSDYNGEITREEILERAQYWIDEGVPYSMTGYYPDLLGRDYRTDCSGFVSMALHATAPGANTVSLVEIAEQISYDDIQPGDFVGTLGEGTGGANGHVAIFDSWTDDSKTEYNTLECKGGDGCVAWVRAVGWVVGPYTAQPYRYIQVVD